MNNNPTVEELAAMMAIHDDNAHLLCDNYLGR